MTPQNLTEENYYYFSQISFFKHIHSFLFWKKQFDISIIVRQLRFVVDLNYVWFVNYAKINIYGSNDECDASNIV